MVDIAPTGRLQAILDELGRVGAPAGRGCEDGEPAAADRDGGGASGGKVSVAQIMESVGRSSFAALLLVPSLVVVSPLSGIPGVPTVAAAVIILICLQYLSGARSLWLPGRIQRITVRRSLLCRALAGLRPLARAADRVVRPRMTFLFTRTTFTLIAIVSCCLAALMPPMEVLPLTSSITAFLIAVLALAALARDGTLAILAIGLIFAALALGGSLLWPIG